MPPRERLVTLGYEDVPLDPASRVLASGVAVERRVEHEQIAELLDASDFSEVTSSPPTPLSQASSGHSAPELTISHTPVGRATMHAIERELAALAPGSENEAAAEIQVHEMLTFVLRGAQGSEFASDETRREFVATRLIHRLPVASMDEIEQIDVTPWTVRGTLILRVWCKVR